MNPAKQILDKKYTVDDIKKLNPCFSFTPELAKNCLEELGQGYATGHQIIELCYRGFDKLIAETGVWFLAQVMDNEDLYEIALSALEGCSEDLNAYIDDCIERGEGDHYYQDEVFDLEEITNLQAEFDEGYDATKGGLFDDLLCRFPERVHHAVIYMVKEEAEQV